ncbi:MAG TPA: hypothetical protein VEY10_20590 [Flavisolibacter sp.]|nr:hypothetical protein [Flavisolibacter sp.]
MQQSVTYQIKDPSFVGMPNYPVPNSNTSVAIVATERRRYRYSKNMEFVNHMSYN